MKSFVAFLLVAMSILLFSFSLVHIPKALALDDFIGDGSFESGSLAVYAAEPRGSWGSTGTQLGGQVSVTSEDKHSGTNSLKIMTTSDDQSAYVYQYFTVGTTTYSYSFWFKGTAGLGTAEVINGWGPPSPLVGGPYNPQVGALMALGTASFPLDGQWHRATAVNTPTTQALYLDGAQISCGAGNTNMPDVTIIGDLTQAAHSITVYIDDVSLVEGQQLEIVCTPPTENTLMAQKGVVAIGETVSLIQKFDTSMGASGKLLSLTVMEPDGDLCKAGDLPEAMPPSGEIVREYPADFSFVTGGGDGFCDTMNIGVYTAESALEVNGVVSKSTVEFESNFFVIPESPIGIIALMGSSLAALGGFIILRRKHGKSQPSLG